MEKPKGRSAPDANVAVRVSAALTALAPSWKRKLSRPPRPSWYFEAGVERGQVVGGASA